MGCSAAKGAPPSPVLLGAEAPKAGVPAPPISESGLWTLLTFHGKYLCSEPSGDAKADRDEARRWENISLESRGEGKIALKGFHGKYLCADPNGVVTWDRDEARSWENFVLCSIGEQKWTLQSFHGKFLCAAKDGFALVADRVEAQAWEQFTCAAVPSASAGVVLQQSAEAKPTEEAGQPLTLAECAVACSTATRDDIVTTIAAMPESSVQKLLAALEAVPEVTTASHIPALEPVVMCANDDTVQIVDDGTEADRIPSRGRTDGVCELLVWRLEARCQGATVA